MLPPGDISFETLCQFFNACQKAQAGKKLKHMENFRAKHLQPGNPDVYEVYQLILPQLDKERGNYNLKEAKLSAALCKACDMDPKVSSHAQAAQNWRKGAATKHAGNFSLVMENYLFSRSCGKTNGSEGAKELKVREVNQKLDELVRSESSEDKVKVLAWLVHHTSPQQMMWIVRIILKELKIGLSETRVLKDFHVDAEDLYNVTMDLRTVCTELKDRNKRRPRKDLEPGQAIRPQLAMMCPSPTQAFRIMKGRTFLVESKFDGERMQLHRDGDSIQFFSRRGREHGALSSYDVLDVMVKRAIRHRRCILDGELVVWNKARRTFEPFGGIKATIIAARDGKSAEEVLEMRSSGDLMTADPDYQAPLVKDIELVFVAFDILFVEDSSVINRPLLERQQLLKEALTASPKEGIPVGRGTVRARMVALLPGVPLMNGVSCSRICNTEADISSMLDEAIRLKEEGIIIKALDSEWKLNDRSDSWLKIKPDYVHANEVDALIIGGYRGSGRHGGKIAEFLLALAEVPRGGATEPSTFMTFCKVGTGMTDDERKAMRERLEPYMLDAHKGRKPPRCYITTGEAKETPDVWISDPMKSIVLELQADVRTIVSRTFATRHSLRFPRVTRIRWDKSPLDVQTDEDLWRIVYEQKGQLMGVEEAEDVEPSLRRSGSGKRRRLVKRSEEKRLAKRARARVPEHFLLSDLSGVEKESDVLKGTKITFLNYNGHNKADMEALVKRLGGEVYANYAKPVTHVIAADRSYPFEANVKRGLDIISIDWLLDCNATRSLVKIKPHHYLHISEKTLQTVPDVCRFGDLFYTEITARDVDVILNSHAHLKDIVIEELPPLMDLPDSGSRLLPQAAEPAGPAVSAARKQKAKRSSLDIIMDVEAELARHGLLDPTASLFRGCNVLIVQLPASGSDQAMAFHGAGLLRVAIEARESVAKTAVELAQVQLQRLALQVQLHGGRVASSINDDVTHIVAVGRGKDAAAAAAAAPAELLAAVGDRVGRDVAVFALRTLRRRLLEHQLHLVTHRWVEDSVATLAEAGEAGRRRSELNYPLSIAPTAGEEPVSTSTRDALRVASWPWEEFGVTIISPPQRREGSRSRSTSPAAEDLHLEDSGPAASTMHSTKRGRQPAKAKPRAAPAGRKKVAAGAIAVRRPSNRRPTQIKGRRRTASALSTVPEVGTGSEKEEADAGSDSEASDVSPPESAAPAHRKSTRAAASAAAAKLRAMRRRRQGGGSGSDTDLEDSLEDGQSGAGLVKKQEEESGLHQRSHTRRRLARQLMDSDDEIVGKQPAATERTASGGRSAAAAQESKTGNASLSLLEALVGPASASLGIAPSGSDSGSGSLPHLGSLANSSTSLKPAPTADAADSSSKFGSRYLAAAQTAEAGTASNDDHGDAASGGKSEGVPAAQPCAPSASAAAAPSGSSAHAAPTAPAAGAASKPMSLRERARLLGLHR